MPGEEGPEEGREEVVIQASVLVFQYRSGRIRPERLSGSGGLTPVAFAALLPILNPIATPVP
ncbi:MAG: hypothetical protein E5X74_01585 [Mesorhizobium sp.]|nr:MAG: hypothetical protein E5X74_01585 [Mesorhizobium sp.]